MSEDLAKLLADIAEFLASAKEGEWLGLDYKGCYFQIKRK